MNYSTLPALAVLGLGDYYSKLSSELWKNFRPSILLDIDSTCGQRLPKKEASLFHHLRDSDDITALVESADAVMILTPNHTHARYAVQFARAGKAVIVEKPIATTTVELADLRALVDAGFPIYFSDYYVDVRAVPLLHLVNCLSPDDWRRDLIAGNLSSQPSLHDLGPILGIRGHIVETYSFRQETWVGKRQAGGAVLDMMIHLLALLRCIFPDQDLEIKRCRRLFANTENTGVGFTEHPHSSEAAEAFAELEGLLVPSATPVVFRVAKGAHTEDRFITIKGKEGSLTQYFHQPHPLRMVTLKNNDVRLELKGNHYALTSLAIRRWFQGGCKTYGWDWSAWAADKAIEARAWHQPAKTGTRVQRASPSEESQSGGSSRRKFISLDLPMLLFAGICAFHEGAEEIRHLATKPNAVTRELEVAAERSEPWLATERMERIARLLGPATRLVLAPGTEHQYGKPTWEATLHGYPHDLQAIAPFRHFARSGVEVLDIDGIADFIDSGDIILATGSPTSSKMARLMMTSNPTFGNLPYRIEEIGPEKFVKVYSGMEKGVREKKGKQLKNITGGTLYSDYDNIDSAGWLRKDVLVVSRLPAVDRQADIIMFSGFHGAGTQAAELLFDPKILPQPDLDKLCSVLAVAKYWQFVLEVDDIENRKPMTLAQSIRLSPFCPPRILPMTSEGVSTVV